MRPKQHLPLLVLPLVFLILSCNLAENLVSVEAVTPTFRPSSTNVPPTISPAITRTLTLTPPTQPHPTVAISSETDTDQGTVLYSNYDYATGETGIYLFNLGTEQTYQILAGIQLDVGLSADRTQLIYSTLDYDLRTGDLFAYDLTEGRNRQLTLSPHRLEMTPRWWPGKPDFITFFTWEDPIGPDGICDGKPALMNLASGEIKIFDSQSCEPLALSPDGKTIVHISAEDRHSPVSIENGQIKAFDLRRYHFNPDEDWRIGSPTWSPDGQKLAWLGRIGQQPVLVLMDMTSEISEIIPLEEQLLGHDGWYYPPVWSPDGRWIATVDPSFTLIQIGGENRRLIDGIDATVAWRSDSEAVIYGQTSYEDHDQGRIFHLLELDSGKDELLPLPPSVDLIAWLPPDIEVYIPPPGAIPQAAAPALPTLVTPTATPSAFVTINNLKYPAWQPCEGQFPSLIQVGDTAYVNEIPPKPNRVREGPSKAYPVIGQISPGSSMIITAGPVCDPPFIWWEIETGQLSGWTAEGDGSGYWLLPVR